MGSEKKSGNFQLGPLPFENWAKDGITGEIVDGIAKTIVSAETLSFHYGKHHAGYVKKLNAALESSSKSDWSDNLEELILQAKGEPAHTKIYNCAAQHWNHTFYWKCMISRSVAKMTSSDLVINKLVTDVGEDWQQKFASAVGGIFGSGWGWLVYNKTSNKIEVVVTSNAANPLGETIPLLVCDVWEHAYYVDYKNNRGQYIKNFMEAINWEFVEQNYKAATNVDNESIKRKNKENESEMESKTKRVKVDEAESS